MILFYEDTNAINLAKADINRFQFAFNCLWGLVGNLFLFYVIWKKRLLGCCKCILRKKAWFVYFVLYNKSKKWNSKMRGLASPLRPSLIKSPFHPSPSEGRDGRRGIGRGWLINIPFSAISSPFPHISTNAF